MVTKSRMKMALAAEKNTDFQKLHQKKVAKLARKEQAKKGGEKSSKKEKVEQEREDVEEESKNEEDEDAEEDDSEEEDERNGPTDVFALPRLLFNFPNLLAD